MWDRERPLSSGERGREKERVRWSKQRRNEIEKRRSSYLGVRSELWSDGGFVKQECDFAVLWFVKLRAERNFAVLWFVKCILGVRLDWEIFLFRLAGLGNWWGGSGEIWVFLIVTKHFILLWYKIFPMGKLWAGAGKFGFYLLQQNVLL